MNHIVPLDKTVLRSEYCWNSAQSFTSARSRIDILYAQLYIDHVPLKHSWSPPQENYEVQADKMPETTVKTEIPTKLIFISVFNQLDAQNLFYNKFYFMPLHVSSTCAHLQEVKSALHETATYRCDDTRGCVMQF